MHSKLMGQELALRSVGEDVVKQGNLTLLKKLKLWLIYLFIIESTVSISGM